MNRPMAWIARLQSKPLMGTGNNNPGQSRLIKKLIASDGAASVEFALLAWLLFAILFLTIEVGLWSTYQVIITSAARDSVMQFSITERASLAMDKALTSGSRLNPALVATDVTLYIDGVASPSTASCQPGQLLTVKITYPRNLITGYNGLTKEALPPMVAESAAVCE